ncbi:hypothetical protein HN51_063329, partial [Arachis hypogaea]
MELIADLPLLPPHRQSLLSFLRLCSSVLCAPPTLHPPIASFVSAPLQAVLVLPLHSRLKLRSCFVAYFC